MSDQDRCHLPDTIIGLGFAGKQTVYQYMQTEWILTEALEPRDDTENPDCNAFVIDTATTEQPGDEAMEKAINDQVLNLCQEEFDRGPESVDTRVRYKNPLEGTNDQYLTEVGLTSETTVREVAGSSSLRAWWLEQDETMLTGGDYGEGVVRRRGLSKALYHVSQTGADPLGDLMARAEGSVAMVVGLGGGTGSGMFLDIAKKLNSPEGNADAVNLFAIVPGTREHRRKKANAHAALSEIEYLSLKDNNPFNNVILIPYGPGRTVDSEEFHDSVIQTIIARENTAPNLTSYLDESSTDGPPVYAPFTVALSQIHRYAVEDQKSAKREVVEICETKLESLQEELQFYNELEAFITEEFGSEPAGEALEKRLNGDDVLADDFSFTEEEIHGLKERYDGFKRFIRTDHFSVLDYDPPQKWQEVLDDLESQLRKEYSSTSEFELSERIITEIPSRVANHYEDPEETYSSETEQTDRQLERIIQDELQAIRRRGDIQRSVHLIKDETIRNGIQAALDPEIGSFSASSNVTDKKNAQTQLIESKTQNLDLLESFLNDSAVEAQLEQHRKDWQTDVESQVQTLIEVDKNQDRLETLLDKLDQDVQSTVQAIQNATHPDGIPDDLLEFDAFDELNERLSATGVDKVDEIRLTNTLTALANAHKEKLKAQEVSLIGRIFRGSDEEHRRRYGRFLDEVDRELVSVSPDRRNFDQPFRCSFNRDEGYTTRLEELDRNAKALPGEICEAFRIYLIDPVVDETTFANYAEDEWNGELPLDESQVEDLPTMEWPGGNVDELVDDLETELEKDLAEKETASVFLSQLCQPGDDHSAPGTVYRGFETTSLEPIRNYRDDLEGKIENDLKPKLNRYDRLEEIIETHGGRQNLVLMDRNSLSDFDIATDTEYTYVRQVASEQTLLQYDDIATAGLWDRDNSERETLENSLEQFAKTAATLDDRVDIKHNTLEVPTATSAGNSTMYQGHFILPVFMSRAFSGTEENPSEDVFTQVKNEYTQRITVQPGEDGYSSKKVAFGGEWDVAQTTFIGGVFLDNFQPVSQSGNGYRAAYHSERDDLIENIRIRHTHGIDGLDNELSDFGHGGFVRREKLFNLNDTRENGDLATFIGLNTEELRDYLFDQSYVVTEQFESTVDLTDL